mgnify:CR=1 FL=1
MALSIIRLQKGKLQESIFIRTVPLIPVLSPHHSSEQKMDSKVALNEGKQ